MSQSSAALTAQESAFDSVSKVTIKLNGRDYVVACGAGEEDRLFDIVRFVDERLAKISQRNDGVSESRLFMLACLMLADELIEMKRSTADQRRKDEELYVAAVEHLQQRIEHMAQTLLNNA